MACANYVGKHVKEVAEAAPKDALGPVLFQAATCGGILDGKGLKSDIIKLLGMHGLSPSHAPDWIQDQYGLGSKQALLHDAYQKVKNM